MWQAIRRDAGDGHAALVAFAAICLGCAVFIGVLIAATARRTLEPGWRTQAEER